MEKNIRLIPAMDPNSFNKILDMIKTDEGLAATFVGGNNTRSRLVSSSLTAFIQDGNKTVGFIMLVENDKTGKHEVDMGILTKYRNQGYGTEALAIVKDLIVREKVKTEIQIENTNMAMIKTALKNGFVLARQDEKCSYFVVDSKKNNSKK